MLGSPQDVSTEVDVRKRWARPVYTDRRQGFEVTMYASARKLRPDAK